MWHEARRHEKVVRKAIVDYRKRAERRHDYYEKIKQDPTKFMQIHGRTAKVHIDESGLQSDNLSSMMPWQGDKSLMIDRYDARALLDYIKEVKSTPTIDITLDKEERKCNYERYRVIVFNKYRGVSEKEHLKDISVKEMYGDVTAQRLEAENAKKHLSASKAQIGYDYGNVISSIVSTNQDEVTDEDDTSDIEAFINGIQDIPLSRDYYTSETLEDIGRCSLEYGMTHEDYAKQLHLDQELQESKERAKEMETEKQKMSGKQSRRQRRMIKDELLKHRKIGRLSYAKYESDEEKVDTDSSSSSSSSEEDSKDRSNSRNFQFVTSFEPTDLSITKRKKKKESASSSQDYYRRRNESPERRRESYERFLKRQSRHRRPGDRKRSRSPRRRSPRSHGDRRRSPFSSGYKRRSRSSSPRQPTTSSATVKSKIAAKSASIAAAAKKKLGDKKLTPQEMLKIKMQRALKKQLKADKNAEAEKKAQEFQDQMDRAEKLREITKKIKRRGNDRIRSPSRDWGY